jgi:hypothetical protein
MSEIKLGRYPYGKSSKAYKEAKKWLTYHGNNGYDLFCYPDYAGMPKVISNKLLSDEVDHIQKCWEGLPPIIRMDFDNYGELCDH